MPAVQRIFVYMPLMHSESGVRPGSSACSCSKPWRTESSVASGSLDYRPDARGGDRRFGRFPHRNEILGRESTPEELAFLKQPGSSF